MQGSASSGLLFPAGSGALLGCCGIERGGAAAIQTGVWVCTWTLTVSKGYSMSLQTKPATMPAPAASRVSAGGGQCSVAIEAKRRAGRCADHERKTYRQLSHFATFGQRSAPHPPTYSLLFPLSASSCPPVAPFSRSPSLPRYSLYVPPGSAQKRRCERRISRQEDGEDGAEMRSPFQRDSDVGKYGPIASPCSFLAVRSASRSGTREDSSTLRDFLSDCRFPKKRQSHVKLSPWRERTRRGGRMWKKTCRRRLAAKGFQRASS